MEISETKLDGVLLITPPTIFEDVRGMYVEIYNEELYAEAGITAKFDEVDTSLARESLGFHAQTALREGIRRTVDWYREHASAWAK